MTTKPRIYLAGPDLFFKDFEERYARLKAACQFAGFEGVAPVDGFSLDTSLVDNEDVHPGSRPHSFGSPPPMLAQAIYRHNITTLEGCDAVLANLGAFRGTEPDSGTVFEASYAFSKGIPVAAYTFDGLSTSDRHLLIRKTFIDQSAALCDREDGGLIENFGLPANLMLALSFPVMQTPQQALERLVAAGLRELV